MMFSVPQFIDVEDKIAGPLTWRQLLWMIAMGAALLTIFAVFDTTLAILLAIPVVILFCLMAFYKPGGFPMTTFIGNFFMFLFRPKVAVWERPALVTRTSKAAPTTEGALVENSVEKQLNHDKLVELARIMDSQGRGR
ncbi:MAG: PrgI family protein [Candidatus Moranbacteria bacterium]|nr:PrgI family protein [Candidatus Moranbacteria bacterium]